MTAESRSSHAVSKRKESPYFEYFLFAFPRHKPFPFHHGTLLGPAIPQDVVILGFKIMLCPSVFGVALMSNVISQGSKCLSQRNCLVQSPRNHCWDDITGFCHNLQFMLHTGLLHREFVSTSTQY